MQGRNRGRERVPGCFECLGGGARGMGPQRGEDAGILSTGRKCARWAKWGDPARGTPERQRPSLLGPHHSEAAQDHGGVPWVGKARLVRV